MNQADDVTQLRDSWLFWSAYAGLTNPSVSEPNPENELRFLSDDYSVHLRHTGDWWVMDTVDDRGRLRQNVAKFSSFGLAKKFLIWQWASAARNALHLNGLGPELYDRGMNPKVEAVEISTGIYELRLAGERAILMEPSATIFSHLMSRSVSDIEAMAKAGITEP